MQVDPDHTEAHTQPDDHLSDAEKEALLLMRGALPSYVTKCFTAAGFDTVEVIKKMDVSDDPANSIQQIEQFIADEHPNLISSKSKKFPPGHRIRIKEFVDSLRQPKLGKRGTSHKETSTSKRPRTSSTASSDTPSDRCSDQLLTNMGKIRRQICNWQRTQTTESLRELKENQHFDVTVSDTGVAHINCLICKKKFQLGIKKNKFLISNWSRHVIKCAENPSDTQTTLGFILSSSSEVPLSPPSPPMQTKDNEEQSDSLFHQIPPAQPGGQEGSKYPCTAIAACHKEWG